MEILTVSQVRFMSVLIELGIIKMCVTRLVFIGMGGALYAVHSAGRRLKLFIYF